MTVAADLTTARQWVGTEPDDDALTVAVADAGGPQEAALVILRTRRADMIANPAKFAVSGDYSQDTSANLAAIDAMIGRIEGALGVDSTTASASFTSTPICGPSMDR